MMVAVAIMVVVKVTIDKVIDMIPVRNGFMPAVGTMLVLGLVTGAVMLLLSAAVGGISRMVVMTMMRVAIVQVIRVATVFFGRVPAVGAMHMIILIMLVVIMMMRHVLGRHSGCFETEVQRTHIVLRYACAGSQSRHQRQEFTD